MLSKLIDRQTREGWTDLQMAARLGCSRALWNMIRRGRAPMTARIQMAAAREFPELLGDLLMQVSDPAHKPSEAA